MHDKFTNNITAILQHDCHLYFVHDIWISESTFADTRKYKTNHSTLQATIWLVIHELHPKRNEKNLLRTPNISLPAVHLNGPYMVYINSLGRTELFETKHKTGGQHFVTGNVAKWFYSRASCFEWGT
jgi:hypothetical protein